MDTLKFNYTMTDEKPIFTTANDNQATVIKETSSDAGSGGLKSVFSPLAPPFQSRMSNETIIRVTQQEPREADTAPATADLDDYMMNLRINSSDLLFNDAEYNSHNYYTGNKADPVQTSQSNIWSEGSSSGGRNSDSFDTFDFLMKSVSSANNYVSMLTREQLSVLRSIRPSLLFEFVQEIARIRSDKRMRRALPNECAFCKNNGENEESYSSHALKDWRGRVLCPVLRAFRCPRCGATGDRAHTIKYCPESSEPGLDRSGSLFNRRRMSSSSLVIGTNTRAPGSGAPATPATPATPAPSPSYTIKHQSSLWSSFIFN